MGQSIKTILNNGNAKLVNGYRSEDEIPTSFNGMGCLAAYLIGELKNKKIGNIYIDPRQKLTKNDFDIEYEYILSASLNDSKLLLDVIHRRSTGNVILFRGFLADFDPILAQEKVNVEVVS
jgi:hypothetical protein